MNRQSQFKLVFSHVDAWTTYGHACGHGEPTVEAGGGRKCIITRFDPISDQKIGFDPFLHGDRSPFHPFTPWLLVFAKLLAPGMISLLG